MCDTNTFKERYVESTKSAFFILWFLKKSHFMRDVEKENMKEQLKDSFEYIKWCRVNNCGGI